MTGVIATLGYRSEKKRFVEEPRMEKRTDKHHIRGVFIDRVVSSVGGTEARTASWGEFSSNSVSLAVEDAESSELDSRGVLLPELPSGLTESKISPKRGASRLNLPSIPDMTPVPSRSSDMDLRPAVDGRDVPDLLEL